MISICVVPRTKTEIKLPKTETPFQQPIERRLVRHHCIGMTTDIVIKIQPSNNMQNKRFV